MHAGSMTALLVTMVLVVFVVPVIFGPGDPRRIANDVALTLLLLTAAAAVIELRPLPVTAAILCLLAIALRWSEWLLPTGMSSVARDGAALLALLIVMLIVAAHVFAHGTVTADRIMGAIALYLLLGIAWAVVYELVSLHVPGAFAGNVASEKGPERWFYFSFVTLTTVGYGDITPAARLTQSLATLEALVGQLYPVIILARLVSLDIEHRKRGA